MLCKRCPHLVRHGKLAADKKTIDFKNMCGLLMRAEAAVLLDPEKQPIKKPVKKPSKGKASKNDCPHFPFPKVFDYMDCSVYLETFKTASRKNDVVPTKDFQYSEVLNGSSITDMELL
ncbi:MAG: hypothetical protein AB7T49_15655 [Oligoflexales bacterium]